MVQKPNSQYQNQTQELEVKNFNYQLGLTMNYKKKTTKKPL